MSHLTKITPLLFCACLLVSCAKSDAKFESDTSVSRPIKRVSLDEVLGDITVDGWATKKWNVKKLDEEFLVRDDLQIGDNFKHVKRVLSKLGFEDTERTVHLGTQFAVIEPCSYQSGYDTYTYVKHLDSGLNAIEILIGYVEIGEKCVTGLQKIPLIRRYEKI